MSEEMKKVSSEEIENVYSVKKRKIPPHFIEQAGNVPLVDYLEKKGLAYMHDSKDTFKLVDHDSLKFTPAKNDAFIWHSTGKKGYGSIKFAMEYYDMNFRDAVRDVLEHSSETIRHIEKSYYQPVEKEPYQYNQSIFDKETSHAEEYLVEKRGIHPDLVEKLLDSGRIRQTSSEFHGKKMYNVAFMWGREGNVIGHEERGVNEGSKFKKIASGVPENRGFSVSFGKPKDLFVFESTIDALSYASMYPTTEARFISLNGLKQNTLHRAIGDFIEDTGNLPNHIVFCTDNDRAGKHFVKEQSAPIYNGTQETTTVYSLPPRLIKKSHNEVSMDAKQLVKLLKNDNNEKVTVKDDVLKISHDLLGELEITHGKDKYNYLDFQKKVEKEGFLQGTDLIVSYKETTKDWNEVLMLHNELEMHLERPIEYPNLINGEIQKEQTNVEEKGIER